MALVTYILGDCPGCGAANSYGNIDVYSTYVARGCQKCRYKEQVALPPINKKILYLDQVFFSVAFRGSQPSFVKATERIKRLTELQLLAVPFSNIHEDETHQWVRHRELLEFIKQTSRGNEFRPAYEVDRTQLLKAFDAWLRQGPAAFQIDPSDVFRDPINVWDGYFRIDVGGCFGNVDLIRSAKSAATDGLLDLLDSWRRSKSTFEYDMLAEHEQAARGYMDTFMQMGVRLVPGDTNALLDSPIMSTYVEALLQHLPREVTMENRLRTVAQFLMSQHFRETPSQDLSARILATTKALVRDGAYKNQDKARDKLSGLFHDVDHVSTYAPYCDAIVLDRGMAELVNRKTVGLSERYGVKVFGAGKFEEILTWFDEIELSMTEQHRQALTQAYPRILLP